MPCQQRAKRRCPRGSSQVPEADQALPADALELLPESRRRNFDRRRSKCPSMSMLARGVRGDLVDALRRMRCG